MLNDPVMEEVRQAADQLAREAGYDLSEYCRRIREHERQYADRLVTLPAQPLDEDVACESRGAAPGAGNPSTEDCAPAARRERT